MENDYGGMEWHSGMTPSPFLGACGALLDAKMKSCKVDYCPTCPEAHSCDQACDLPCAGGDGSHGHRRQLLLRLLAELGEPASDGGGGARRSIAIAIAIADPRDLLMSRV